MTWRIIGDQPERAREWCKANFPETYPENPKLTALINEWDGDIRGCVLYTDWYPDTSINVHLAGAAGRWLTKALLFAAFDYPFNQLKVRRVNGLIAASNTLARRFADVTGMKQEGYLPKGWPGVPKGDDLVIYGMLKENCRWITPEFRQRVFLNGQTIAARSPQPASNGSGANPI